MKRSKEQSGFSQNSSSIHSMVRWVSCVTLASFIAIPAFAQHDDHRDDHYRKEAPHNVKVVKGPRRGDVVTVVPGGIFRNHHGVNYTYSNGYFYRPQGRGFIVVAPPLGFRIDVLPLGFTTFMLANAAYYYYAGAYYQRMNNSYVVVQPPVGALVSSIPDGGQQLQIEGNTYYIVDGIQYQAVVVNGVIMYKVMQINQ
jgi:hypothetical protein